MFRLRFPSQASRACIAAAVVAAGGATASPGAAGRSARHKIHMQERAWGRMALNGKHSGRLAATKLAAHRQQAASA